MEEDTKPAPQKRNLPNEELEAWFRAKELAWVEEMGVYFRDEVSLGLWDADEATENKMTLALTKLEHWGLAYFVDRKGWTLTQLGTEVMGYAGRDLTFDLMEIRQRLICLRNEGMIKELSDGSWREMTKEEHLHFWKEASDDAEEVNHATEGDD